MLRREKSMAKVAVLMAEGYEEGETLTIVDILRRADIETATFYFGDDEFVKGMHNMYIKADKKFGSEVYEYDVVVLPGGRPGGANLLANPEVKFENICLPYISKSLCKMRAAVSAFINPNAATFS
jgi:putative intracellular protease/amidase